MNELENLKQKNKNLDNKIKYFSSLICAKRFGVEDELIAQKKVSRLLSEKVLTQQLIKIYKKSDK